MHYEETDSNFKEKENNWLEVERLVLNYQKQFEDNATEEDTKIAKKSAEELIIKFNPLIKKYIKLITTGQINWDDEETKSFIYIFLEDPELRRALGRKRQSSKYRDAIHVRFDFVVKTYGTLSRDELEIDLQSLLLLKARKYKQMGKNFCSYITGAYRYEVGRHIKKFTNNPLNIQYKNIQYEDYIHAIKESPNESYEDNYYEETTGIPSLSWITGTSCSDIFSSLTTIDRKILVKYYLEDCKDGQVAELLGMHINTVNQRRRAATKKLAESLNIDIALIKRTRRSGKKAMLSSIS